MKEQTTLRLPQELADKLKQIAEKEGETVNAIVIAVVKKIIKRYRFDERGKLIV